MATKNLESHHILYIFAKYQYAYAVSLTLNVLLSHDHDKTHNQFLQRRLC